MVQFFMALGCIEHITNTDRRKEEVNQNAQLNEWNWNLEGRKEINLNQLRVNANEAKF